MDHLRGKRAAVYDATAGPGAGHPRVVERPDGRVEVVDGQGDPMAWGLNAMCLGGGTRLGQGMSWRFMAEDFRMASTYGVPEGSTLSDWPFDYDELAPYYDRIEWELGVSGSSEGPLVVRSARSRGYPMRPLPDDAIRDAFGAAANRLGWVWGPPPFAINSEPRGGRAASVACAQCCGHACPVDAKNGTQNTFLPRAVTAGRCDLLVSAQALKIEHDGNGGAVGVLLACRDQTRTVGCSQVVVAGGAVETPRLLLASGLGNDWVGRNHHSHGVALAIAREAPPVNSFVGPGHSDWVSIEELARHAAAMCQ